LDFPLLQLIGRAREGLFHSLTYQYKKGGGGRKVCKKKALKWLKQKENRRRSDEKIWGEKPQKLMALL
jgi:hypothetical protein